MAATPWTRDVDGLRLALRLTPRAGRDAFASILAGPDGRPALAVRLAAPPVEGAANTALIAFLAHTLAVPKSRIAIRSGKTARFKIVAIDGDPDELEARLRKAVGLRA